jgi:hypothetical protein
MLACAARSGAPVPVTATRGDYTGSCDDDQVEERRGGHYPSRIGTRISGVTKCLPRELCSHLSAGADISPVGATNKIFYIAGVSTIIGFILDLLPQIKNYSKILAAIMSLSIVGWIAYPRFAKPDIDLATSLGLWLGGIALLWRLDTVARTPTERNGGGVAGIAMLASLLLGFAPVALFGGSSTSMTLCLAAVAGLAAAALWELIIPRQTFGASAVFGVGCGLLAMIDP